MNPTIVLRTVQQYLKDTVYPSTCSVSDAGARLVACELSRHLAGEAGAWRRLWPEAASRYLEASDSLLSIACYEDEETVQVHRDELERYEDRAYLRRHA